MVSSPMTVGITRDPTCGFVIDVWRSSRLPTWNDTAPPVEIDPMDGPRLVLAAVDESVSANHAALYAAGLARRNHAQLAYLYVRQALPSVLWFEALGGPLDEVFRGSHAAEILDEFAEMSERIYGICAEKLVAEGTPAREIARIADERRVDAVVVGCSCRPIHRIVGSTSRWLVSHGNWPVMVVP